MQKCQAKKHTEFILFAGGSTRNNNTGSYTLKKLKQCTKRFQNCQCQNINLQSSFYPVKKVELRNRFYSLTKLHFVQDHIYKKVGSSRAKLGPSIFRRSHVWPPDIFPRGQQLFQGAVGPPAPRKRRLYYQL